MNNDKDFRVVHSGQSRDLLKTYVKMARTEEQRALLLKAIKSVQKLLETRADEAGEPTKTTSTLELRRLVVGFLAVVYGVRPQEKIVFLKTYALLSGAPFTLDDLGSQ